MLPKPHNELFCLFTGANVFFLPLFADSEIIEGTPAHIQEISPFAIHFSSVTTGMIKHVGYTFLFKGCFWFHS
jgi:hypothetical protein